jgi:hypothetical protein
MRRTRAARHPVHLITGETWNSYFVYVLLPVIASMSCIGAGPDRYLTILGPGRIVQNIRGRYRM